MSNPLKEAALFTLGLASLGAEKAGKAVGLVREKLDAGAKEGRVKVESFLHDASDAKDRVEIQVRRALASGLETVGRVAGKAAEKVGKRLSELETALKPRKEE